MLHPYPHTHFIFTAVCPRIIWNKAKGNRRFFRSLNRAVKTLRRFFFFIFLKALHEDLFDRFAAYGEIAHLRRCIPVQGEQVQVSSRCLLLPGSR